MFHFDVDNLFRLFAYDPAQPLIFNSGLFLFLFTFFLFVYTRISHAYRPKLIFVTLFSLYFYYKSSGVYFLLILVSTVSDFNLAKLLHNTSFDWKRKLLVALTLLINLGMLGYFKYTNFIYESFFWNSDREFQPLDIFLPVGVSFFTFQSLSYTLDVYRRRIAPEKHILDYAFFVTFFPQLVAGPIVRAADFLPQIHKPTVVTDQMFGRGIFLIGTGLFKKAVISDYISVNFVDRVFDSPLLYTGVENLFAIYGYALQIYCDFSGYSDMAIGLALILGFSFPLNFNAPYKSKNITEFWRRWHISLSTWLRDYLYISLGGNRRGRLRTYINLMITMTLGGLWHGASWRFILWGVLHGAGLAVHKMFRTLFPEQHGFPLHRTLNVLKILLTFHFVCFCWIFFRVPNIDSAFEMIEQVYSNFSINVFFQMIVGYKEIMFLMLIGYLIHFVPDRYELQFQEKVSKAPLIMKAVYLFVTIMIVIQVKSAEVQPFIYFQF
ncbi:MAG TPA: MBOAT family protein [Chryseosolibacter sp.]|nr:MBOAT family protein [Chryseosolibacter sp.]